MSDDAILAGLLAGGAPVEEVLDAVDGEIERAEAAGDAEALDRLVAQLTKASRADESYAALAIAAARAAAVATRLRPTSAAPPIAASASLPVATHEPIEVSPPGGTAEPPVGQGVAQPVERGTLQRPAILERESLPAGAYAGFWVRLVAFVVDWVVVGVALGLLDSVTADTEPVVLVLLLLPLAYFAGMTAFAGGATLGKKMLGVAVRIDDGRPVGLGRAVGRAVATFALAMMIVGWLADVIVLGADRRKQSVHDKIAGTVVVRIRAGAFV